MSVSRYSLSIGFAPFCLSSLLLELLRGYRLIHAAAVCSLLLLLLLTLRCRGYHHRHHHYDHHDALSLCSWVARDMSGATFSDWYPYLREGTSQALMRANHPFRVFSCWNGGVVVPAAYVLHDGITFRTWRSGEVRSLHPNADKSEVR